MTREVECHEGKCWEVKQKRVKFFDDLFPENNVVYNIEKDLWKKNFYG